MNNSEHNQRNFSDRARLGIAAGAAFIGILIAGLSEHPAIALSGTAQQEADAQSGPGIGLETADSSKTSPAEPAGPGTAAADPELQHLHRPVAELRPGNSGSESVRRKTLRSVRTGDPPGDLFRGSGSEPSPVPHDKKK